MNVYFAMKSNRVRTDVKLKLTFDPMNFSDTHCHIYTEAFDEDFNAAILRAKENSVNRFFLPNIDWGYLQRLKKVASLGSEFYPMMGMQPCSINKDYEEELEKIRKELFFRPNEYYGVGEIGLDLYWDKTNLD